ncbi:MAG: DNA-binding protein WhiA [Clostridia bacterium]|nr:DNA-binding protein WhiA [Clostridia bacterium]MBR4261463.1 DNA-binding protein WhiA [Clostridia bacterium]
MSFSKNIKEELSKMSNLSKKDEVKAELLGYLITNNIDINSKKIKYSTESEYNINRFAKLLNNINVSKYEIDIQGKVFSINVKEKIELDELDCDDTVFKVNNKINTFVNNEMLEKALVRGSFLGSGSVNNPEKIYHLEVIYSSEQNVDYVIEILNKYDINAKKMNNTLYLKDGEEISKFLAFIGANSAVLKFEEIRVIRDMRNNVNRLVNCETANLNKTINAALKQIEDIKFVKKMKKFNELPLNVQEVANLRLEYPEISLVELGRMLTDPVGKSGVNYRLKQISILADELRK